MPLTRDQYELLLWTSSWIVGYTLVLARGGSWRRGLGLALLLSPFARMALDFSLSVGALFTFKVLQPVSQAALWSSIVYRVLFYLIVPAIGLLLMHDAWRREPRAVTAELLRAHGLAPRSTPRRDVARGLALFFAIAVAYVVAWLVAREAANVVYANGDESRYWRNITIPLIVLVSGVAGLSEELLFRGILFSALLRRMSWWPAALLQAFLFALIHTGYGTWAHLVGPFVFGLGLAWVVRVLGVWPAALLHAEVNVLFFALDVAPTYLATNGAWGVAALAALVLAVAAAGAYALWRTKGEAFVLLWRSARAGFA